MNEETLAKKQTRYMRLLEKRIVKSPEISKIIQRRTLRSAMAVIRCLDGLDFTDFSHTLFFLCANSNATEFNRIYQAQLELALIDEERFVKDLHKFYKDTAKKIIDENLYSTYFQFRSFFCLRRYTYNDTPRQRAVAEAYMDLLLQQGEYLRDDLNKVVAGITTDGEPILVDDHMPFLDSITFTLEHEALVLKKLNTPLLFNRRLRALLTQHGLAPMSLDDLERLCQTDRIYANTISTMSPYINEYTVDMLPGAKNAIQADISVLSFLHVDSDIDELKDGLKHRARTLASNGVEFTFQPVEDQIFRRVKMKEVLFDNEIIMLYKVETMIGETSGFYNTHTGLFFSLLIEASADQFYYSLQRLILYLYSCAVLRNGKDLLDKVRDVIRFHDVPGGNIMTIDYTLKTALNSGKPRDVYHQKSVERDESKYQYEMRQIQGFVRRLPEGRKASQEAQDRAALLGFDLEYNETYVQGFVKNVQCLMAADEETS